MVIRWTPLTPKSLKDIYNFYLPDAGRRKETYSNRLNMGYKKKS